MSQSIVSDRDLNFHHEAQLKQNVQTLEDMMWACVLDFKGKWDEHLLLIDFADNNSFQSTIGIVLSEALYGRKCISEIYWSDLGDRRFIDPELVQQ